MPCRQEDVTESRREQKRVPINRSSLPLENVPSIIWVGFLLFLLQDPSFKSLCIFLRWAVYRGPEPFCHCCSAACGVSDVAVCADREVVIDRNDICALDAAICLFFVVLRGRHSQEYFLPFPADVVRLPRQEALTGKSCRALQRHSPVFARVSGQQQNTLWKSDVLTLFMRQLSILLYEHSY